MRNYERNRSDSNEREKVTKCEKNKRDFDREWDKKSKASDSHRSKSDKPRMFKFERFRSKLDKIFFRSDGFIKQGSEEYKDFWQFLVKYQHFEKLKNAQIKHRDTTNNVSEELGVSIQFDKDNVSCFSLLPKDPRDLLNRISFQDSERGEAVLTLDMLTEFQHILQIFINFLQKEKMAKLKKLRTSQSNLPIAEYKQQILDTVEENQVVIVAGDTGCGKSTQVPQYLLQAGYTNIACTQPRRIACISLASRVSFETLNQYGQEIGYQIRFEKQKTKNTKCVFLTEGLLLRQISSDASLASYNVIVLDEVHERHLHGDFLLGVVKCLLQHRQDLRLILMSATINIDLFKDYFNGEAPVIQVPGRLYPISLEYHPVPCIEDSDRLNPAPYVRILQIIDKKYPTTQRGDLLIFLSGIQEITRVLDACKQYAELNNKWIILPLHSTLSLSEQEKVFDYPPEGIRKAIVSTNIAETSVTIDGIRFVCDSGKVKEMTYDPVCKMLRLKEFWVSRASAEQRKGRAGRTGPGVCFRLYAEKEYAEFSPYSKPEIERVPLDSLVLQLISMGLPDARKFPFIEPPPPESLENSILVLKEQGALDHKERLTAMGKTLSNIPVDVCIGKILINGSLFHQVDSVLTLAAALSVQSPFTNQAYRDSDCMASRRNLDSDHGDPLTLLNAYREWLYIKMSSKENSKKWCKKRGLEEQRFYDMTKLRSQFEELLQDSGLLEEDKISEGLTSAERMARHGELKHLKEAKRNHQKEGPRKKKTLKFDTEDVEEEDDGTINMGDIDFRLRNDAGKIRKLVESSKAVSYKDVTMLKLILSSGLYPQFGVADEYNNYKSGCDQLFHARVKPFNVLHPNSIFANQPEVLQLDSLDIQDIPGFTNKNPPSNKHQILVYLSLLETTKPYMTSSIRVPALPILLLFSHSLETNADMSRIICDSWLEIKCADPNEAQIQLLKAVNIRKQWLKLLNLKLDMTINTVRNDNASLVNQHELESQLSKNLIDFVHNETVYSIKRLLPADLKVAYVGRNFGVLTDIKNPFEPEFSPKPHDEKGGMMLTANVNYNCLRGQADEGNALDVMDWKCCFCQIESQFTVLEKLVHYMRCYSHQEVTELRAQLKEQQQDSGRKEDGKSKDYYCKNCNKTFLLPPIEFLKHKKSCSI